MSEARVEAMGGPKAPALGCSSAATSASGIGGSAEVGPLSTSGS